MWARIDFYECFITKDGDKYYNMGDVLVVNEKYEVSFCDRVGDTFRWKGENVSTNEVSDTIVQAPGVKESNVYGVEVPGEMQLHGFLMCRVLLCVLGKSCKFLSNDAFVCLT